MIIYGSCLISHPGRASCSGHPVPFRSIEAKSIVGTTAVVDAPFPNTLARCHYQHGPLVINATLTCFFSNYQTNPTKIIPMVT
jgi:hypothetical protein